MGKGEKEGMAKEGDSLGALLSWQEEGGGGWLRHPIASPPVLKKTTVSLPEIKTQAWICWTQILMPKTSFLQCQMGLILLLLNPSQRYFSFINLFRRHVTFCSLFLTLPCPLDRAWRNALSDMRWGYSGIIGRVCPSPQILVIVAGRCSLSSQTGKLHS